MELSRSVVAYKVFRNILLDEESYSVQLELKHGLDEEHSEQIILKAADEGFLKVVKDSNPRQYKVNFDKLVEEWYRLWEEETGEEPVPPRNFESFLKKYSESYMKNEKHSTIREMMVEEFYLGLSQETSEAYLTKDFRELKERLGNRFKGKRSAKEHIKYGLNNR